MNEVGISVSFAERGAISDYHIEAIHNLFRDELPLIERAPAAPGPEVLFMNGRPPLNMDQSIGRWWFKSEDDTIVLQLQENFIGLNWRRRSSFDVPSEYPGYDQLIERFEKYVRIIASWHESMESVLPHPIAVELFYDDLVQFHEQSDRAELSSVIKFWSSRPSPMIDWNIGWLEPLDRYEGTREFAGAVMRFVAMAASATDPVPPHSSRPIVRLTYSAMSPCDSWGRGLAFLGSAHSHIRTRFEEMIVPEARDSWGVQ